MEAILECLVSDRIGPSSETVSLVNRACELWGREEALAVREYSRAIEMSFDYLNLKSGDKIIISPLAGEVYRHIIIRRGLVPLMPDIEAGSGLFTAERVETFMDEKPSALIAGTVLGQNPDYEALNELPLPLIQDLTGAPSFDTEGPLYSVKPVFSILSLESDQVLTAGGGALLFAGNKESAEWLRNFHENYNRDLLLPDMNAALALAQIRDLPGNLEKGFILMKLFRDALAKTRHSFPGNYESRVPSVFPVLVKGNVNEVRQYARKKNIETSLAFTGCLWESFSGNGGALPLAEQYRMSCVLFPFYPSLGKKDTELLVRVLSTLP